MAAKWLTLELKTAWTFFEGLTFSYPKSQSRCYSGWQKLRYEVIKIMAAILENMAAILVSRGSQASTIVFHVLQQVLERMEPPSILLHQVAHGTPKLPIKETHYNLFLQLT